MNFRAWAAACKVYGDAPGEVPVSDQEKVLAAGVAGGFMPLPLHN